MWKLITKVGIATVAACSCFAVSALTGNVLFGMVAAGCVAAAGCNYFDLDM